MANPQSHAAQDHVHAGPQGAPRLAMHTQAFWHAAAPGVAAELFARGYACDDAPGRDYAEALCDVLPEPPRADVLEALAGMKKKSVGTGFVSVLLGSESPRPSSQCLDWAAILDAFEAGLDTEGSERTDERLQQMAYRHYAGLNIIRLVVQPQTLGRNAIIASLGPQTPPAIVAYVARRAGASGPGLSLLPSILASAGRWRDALHVLGVLPLSAAQRWEASRDLVDALYAMRAFGWASALKGIISTFDGSLVLISDLVEQKEEALEADFLTRDADATSAAQHSLDLDADSDADSESWAECACLEFDTGAGERRGLFHALQSAPGAVRTLRADVRTIGDQEMQAVYPAASDAAVSEFVRTHCDMGCTRSCALVAACEWARWDVAHALLLQYEGDGCSRDYVGKSSTAVTSAGLSCINESSTRPIGTCTNTSSSDCTQTHPNEIAEEDALTCLRLALHYCAFPVVRWLLYRFPALQADDLETCMPGLERAPLDGGRLLLWTLENVPLSDAVVLEALCYAPLRSLLAARPSLCAALVRISAQRSSALLRDVALRVLQIESSDTVNCARLLQPGNNTKDARAAALEVARMRFLFWNLGVPQAILVDIGREVLFSSHTRFYAPYTVALCCLSAFYVLRARSLFTDAYPDAAAALFDGDCNMLVRILKGKHVAAAQDALTTAIVCGMGAAVRLLLHSEDTPLASHNASAAAAAALVAAACTGSACAARLVRSASGVICRHAEPAASFVFSHRRAIIWCVSP